MLKYLLYRRLPIVTLFSEITHSMGMDMSFFAVFPLSFLFLESPIDVRSEKRIFHIFLLTDND
jgi:hypothetical protein